MNDGRCATCKWWGTDWGITVNICHRITEHSDDDAPWVDTEDMGFCEGGEATFATPSDFGCTLWEPRDEQ